MCICVYESMSVWELKDTDFKKDCTCLCAGDINNVLYLVGLC